MVAVFAVVYPGMFLGGLPRLKLDRSGVALLAAIALIALTGQTVEDSAKAVDLPSVALLLLPHLQGEAAGVKPWGCCWRWSARWPATCCWWVRPRT